MNYNSCLLSVLLLFSAMNVSANTHMLPDVSDLESNTYRSAQDVEPANLNTFYSFNLYALAIINKLAAKLITFDENYRLHPQLAKRWTRSEDGKQYTFFLRQDAKFHNGDDFEASDVVATFTRLLDPKLKTLGAKFLMDVKGAREFISGESNLVAGFETPDAYTFKVTLNKRNNNFLLNLATYSFFSIMPKEHVMVGQAREGRNDEIPILAGPYVLEAWKRGESIKLKLFDDYFDKEGWVPQIEYWYPDHPFLKKHSAESLFLAGKLDMLRLSDETKNANKLIEKKPDSFSMVVRSELKQRFIAINSRRPPFDNILVRQALHYALDKESQVAQKNERQSKVISHSTLYNRLPGFDKNRRFYEYNPSKAKELLVQAGYREDLSDFPVLQTGEIENEKKIKINKHLKDSLSSIGIKVENTEFPSWPAFSKAVTQGKFNLFPLRWQLDYPSMDSLYLEVFHSEGTSYSLSAQKKSTKLDEMIEQAASETNVVKKSHFHQVIDEYLMNSALVLPYYYEVASVLFNKRIDVSKIQTGDGESIHELPVKGVVIDNDFQ